MFVALLNMLGFAQKAGKIVSGDQAVLEKIKRGRVKLVIIAADAAENTRDKLSATAGRENVPCRVIGNKIQLGGAVGKSPRAAVAIMDPGFAVKIAQLIDGS